MSLFTTIKSMPMLVGFFSFSEGITNPVFSKYMLTIIIDMVITGYKLTVCTYIFIPYKPYT